LKFLLDTNIVSELRKGSRADDNVRRWFEGVDDEALHLSVLVVGELRQGIERRRRRDPASAMHLERWLQKVVDGYADRIIGVDAEIAEAWGRLNVPDPLPVIDGLLAATALLRDMTLVTRNTADVVRCGVPVVNPFSE
jgi:predicted nucleic acid-binding protein